MPSSQMTSNGQITLPMSLREHLGLRPGDRVAFLTTPDGRIFIEKEVPGRKLLPAEQPAAKKKGLDEFRVGVAFDDPNRRK